MKAKTSWLHRKLNVSGTGGLNWHLRALRSRRLWAPTSEHIASALNLWRPQSQELLLIGPSAGWMLPTAWLARFKIIHAFDPDALAAPLFHQRHGRRLKGIGTQVVHHRMDAIAGLPHLLAEHPHAALWFDNVLGQLRYVHRDEVELNEQLKRIRSQLKHRSWGSVHDWLSGAVQSPPPIQSVGCHWVHLNDQGLKVCRADGTNVRTSDEIQRLLASVHANGVWQDHGCQDMFPLNTRRCWIPWSFSAQHWHWLELGWVNA
jgi:hypothetical protein